VITFPVRDWERDKRDKSSRFKPTLAIRQGIYSLDSGFWNSEIFKNGLKLPTTRKASYYGNNGK